MDVADKVLCTHVTLPCSEQHRGVGGTEPRCLLELRASYKKGRGCAMRKLLRQQLTFISSFVLSYKQSFMRVS